MHTTRKISGQEGGAILRRLRARASAARPCERRARTCICRVQVFSPVSFTRSWRPFRPAGAGAAGASSSSPILRAAFRARPPAPAASSSAALFAPGCDIEAREVGSVLDSRNIRRRRIAPTPPPPASFPPPARAALRPLCRIEATFLAACYATHISRFFTRPRPGREVGAYPVYFVYVCNVDRLTVMMTVT